MSKMDSPKKEFGLSGRTTNRNSRDTIHILIKKLKTLTGKSLIKKQPERKIEAPRSRAP